MQSYSHGNSYGHNRLGNVNVFIDDKLCGQIQGNTRGTSRWYTVKCKYDKPLIGGKVRLVTTRSNHYLAIQNIKVYGLN